MGFIPPFIGLEGEYNTFRIGVKWHKTLAVGEQVAVVNEKVKEIISYAEVTALYKGSLIEMLEQHANKNHTGLNAEDLGKFILKLYGPHIVNDNKLTTVIYLKCLNLFGSGLQNTPIKRG